MSLHSRPILYPIASESCVHSFDSVIFLLDSAEFLEVDRLRQAPVGPVRLQLDPAERPSFPVYLSSTPLYFRSISSSLNFIPKCSVWNLAASHVNPVVFQEDGYFNPRRNIERECCDPRGLNILPQRRSAKRQQKSARSPTQIKSEIPRQAQELEAIALQSLT